MVPIDYVVPLDDTPSSARVAMTSALAPNPRAKPPLNSAWGSPERSTPTRAIPVVKQPVQLPTPPSAASKPRVTAANKALGQAAPLPPNYSPAAARARAADAHKRRLNEQGPKPTVPPPTRAPPPPRLPAVKPSAVLPPESIAVKHPPSSKPPSGGVVPRPTLRPKPKPDTSTLATIEPTLAASKPKGGARRPPPPRKPPVLVSPSPVSPEMLGLPGQILSPPRRERQPITEL